MRHRTLLCSSLALVAACNREAPNQPCRPDRPDDDRSRNPETRDDGRALCARRSHRRHRRAARQRAAGAGQAGRGREGLRRAVPPAGVGRQRADAAGPGARQLAARSCAAALLPDQQGTLVAARPQRAVHRRRTRESRRKRTSIRRARRRTKSRPGSRGCRAPNATRATGFFTTIRRGPDGRFMAVPYSLEYQGEIARVTRRCCVRRRR